MMPSELSLPPAAPQADPTDFTNRYNTKLSPAEEAKYQEWAAALGSRGNTYDYDLRGAYKAGAGQSENGHFTDEFKKPNHPTFSDQSKYSSEETPGGKWGRQQDGSWTFTPSDTSIALHGRENLQQYFQRVEPKNKLVLPPQSALEAVDQGVQQTP